MYTLQQLQTTNTTEAAKINGVWVPARPENHKYRTLRQRLREAWAVFTGKADAFTWPEGQ